MNLGGFVTKMMHWNELMSNNKPLTLNKYITGTGIHVLLFARSVLMYVNMYQIMLYQKNWGEIFKNI